MDFNFYFYIYTFQVSEFLDFFIGACNIHPLKKICLSHDGGSKDGSQVSLFLIISLTISMCHLCHSILIFVSSALALFASWTPIAASPYHPHHVFATVVLHIAGHLLPLLL
jgi:hypothetical protein